MSVDVPILDRRGSSILAADLQPSPVFIPPSMVGRLALAAARASVVCCHTGFPPSTILRFSDGSAG